MNDLIFHVLFIGSLSSMIALRVYYGRKARLNRGDVEYKEGKANLAVRLTFGFGYIGALIVYLFAHNLFGWASISLPDGLRVLGAIITISSVLLLWWVQSALDIQFDGTLHTQSDHKLISHGPYRWVRHPMYTTFFVMGLGWFLLTANWFVGIPLMLAIIMVVLSRVQKEEDALTELFGDEYRSYMNQTGRFLPLVFR